MREMGWILCVEYESSLGRTAMLMSNQESGCNSRSVTRLAILAIASTAGPGRAL